MSDPTAASTHNYNDSFADAVAQSLSSSNPLPIDLPLPVDTNVVTNHVMTASGDGTVATAAISSGGGAKDDYEEIREQVNRLNVLIYFVCTYVTMDSSLLS